MNRVTRRALMISRKASEYYLAKQGFRITEEKPEEKPKEDKAGQKMSSTTQTNGLQ